MAKDKNITAERARQLLDYNPDTGELTWNPRTDEMFETSKIPKERARRTWNTRYANKAAGTRDPEGYLYAVIDGERISGAFLAWLIHYGKAPKNGIVRFVSGNQFDLRLENLREPYSPDEIRERGLEAMRRYLSVPENKVKHIAAVGKSRKKPHAKEKHRIRQLDYASRNREQERKRAEDWRNANPERAAKSKRDYYLKNRESRKAAAKKWRDENKEAVVLYRVRRDSMEKCGNISKGFFDFLFGDQKGLCVACEADLSISGFHVDHIVPLSKGGKHMEDNLQLLCPSCNLRKSDRPFDVFLEIIRKEKHERTSLSPPIDI